jgi:hypothetical protein
LPSHVGSVLIFSAIALGLSLLVSLQREIYLMGHVLWKLFQVQREIFGNREMILFLKIGIHH